jgi:rhamnulokinase
VHRFGNLPVTAGGTLYWDILRLYAEVRHGLEAAARQFPLASAGIDSWGVDYGLLDESGALLGNPVHYRDARTEGVAARVHAAVPADELYAVTGIQQLPFNTIYQLAADAGRSPQARTMLLIPDLLAYWLTGSAGRRGHQRLDHLAVRRPRPDLGGGSDPQGRPPAAHLPAAAPAGRRHRPYRRTSRWSPLPVIAVGSHDTASAVVAVPATGPHFAYISSGTWSLAGMELAAPVLTEASRAANFTNETGIDGTIRYLRNVMGLWLLQESLRGWPEASLDSLLARGGASAGAPVRGRPGRSGVPAARRHAGRIAAWLADRGEAAPGEPAETVRCILDSLALAYRRAICEAQSLSGRHADVVHIVGGGALNTLLCQLTADATGLPVTAGPAEATASATCWSRPARWARRRATWPGCVPCCGLPSRCAPSHPRATLPPGPQRPRESRSRLGYASSMASERGRGVVRLRTWLIIRP